MEQIGSHWTDFRENSYLSIFRKSFQKIQVLVKSGKNVGTLHEDLCILVKISRPFIPRTRNVADKSCKDTHFVCYKILPEKKCLLWNNVENCCTAGEVTKHNITWCMSFACWIKNARNRHSEYTTFIGFPKLKMVARTRLNISVTPKFPLLFKCSSSSSSSSCS